MSKKVIRFKEAIDKIQESHESMFWFMNSFRTMYPMLEKAILENRRNDAHAILTSLKNQVRETESVLYPEENELHTESKGVSQPIRTSSRKKSGA